MNTTTVCLTDMLALHQDLFDTLAEDWLALGASTFEVWEDGILLLCRPHTASPDTQAIVAPITFGGQIVGELRAGGTADTSSAHMLTSDAAIIARILRLEIEQESIISQLIETQDQLLAVYDLTRSECYQTYYIDVDQLLSCLIREIVRMLKADGGFLCMNSDQHPNHMTCFSEQSDELCDACHYYSQYLETSDTELLLNRDTSDTDLPNSLQNLLLVPIQIHDNLRIGIGLVNKRGGFMAPDMKLVRAIADQTSARIENFLLHQDMVEQMRLHTEMHMAHQVQQRLVPQHFPQIDGIDIYADWRPARQASGDFYDFIVRPDGPLIVTVGDISGKGMPAALLMVETLTEIRSQAKLLFDPNPADILRCINTIMYEDFTSVEMLATVFIGQFDPSCNELYYANAGHAPVIYCPASGTPRLLKADGPPLGILPTITYTNQSVKLQTGDIVIVATDGFNESFNSTGEMFGYDRMLRLVSHHRQQNVQDIATALFDAVDAFVGQSDEAHMLDDDQAIIIIKRTESTHTTCGIQKNKVLRLHFPSSPVYLDMVGKSIHGLLESTPIPTHTESVSNNICLAVHELCANIMQHAYRNTEGSITITLILASQPWRLIAETYDIGITFDPTLVPEPEMLGERGRGLHLIRKLIDEITYFPSGGHIWQSRAGNPWTAYHATHPQPGNNVWRLIKLLS